MKSLVRALKNILIMSKVAAILIYYLLFFKKSKRRIWVFCETDMSAQDNGYHLFRWMRKNHPEVECYYLINKKSKDYKKVSSLGNIIPRLSFQHILYLFMAEKHVGTHDYRQWAYPGKRSLFQKYFERYIQGEFIQLQHGILHMRGERGFHYDPEVARYDKVVVSSEWERDLLVEHFGHPTENLVVTGLARYDKLYDKKTRKNKIFCMPTWRMDIRRRDLFLESEYYRRMKEILTSQVLIDRLRRDKIELKFYLHIKLHNFIDLFKEFENDVIKVVEAGQEDVQSLLMESKLLITDYSSISFDFIYMRKPVVFYQYDYKEYIESYKVEGYEEYRENRFGYIAYNSKDLIDKVIYYVDTNFKAEKKYIEKSNKFFKFRDNKNCQRIYNEIIK